MTVLHLLWEPVLLLAVIIGAGYAGCQWVRRVRAEPPVLGKDPIIRPPREGELDP